MANFTGECCTLVLDKELGIIVVPESFTCPNDHASAARQYPGVRLELNLKTEWFGHLRIAFQQGWRFKVSALKCEDSRQTTSSAVEFEMRTGDGIFLGYAGILELCRQHRETLIPGMEYVAVGSENEGSLIPSVRLMNGDEKPLVRGYYPESASWDPQITRFLLFEFLG